MCAFWEQAGVVKYSSGATLLVVGSIWVGLALCKFCFDNASLTDFTLLDIARDLLRVCSGPSRERSSVVGVTLRMHCFIPPGCSDFYVVSDIAIAIGQVTTIRQGGDEVLFLTY
ncbi:hypothetical protein KC19_5G127800 [Ceratodon purpureus]|uniref:Uncharacterized protein n=1 Tax=Ceratodon purpureus TaxID=3225 RepID=A0A8T0I204_CERPU|nr:hypothetical protein KC19_5G127800 [Ceratodon purpureus]